VRVSWEDHSTSDNTKGDPREEGAEKCFMGHDVQISVLVLVIASIGAVPKTIQT